MNKIFLHFYFKVLNMMTRKRKKKVKNHYTFSQPWKAADVKARLSPGE